MRNSKIVQNKFLGWLIPPISEMEYVFFVTLFLSTFAFQMLAHPQAVTSFFFDSDSTIHDSVRALLSATIYLLVLIVPAIALLLKAVKSKKRVQSSYKGRYVITPLLVMAIVGPLSLVLGKDPDTQPLLLQLATAIIIIRYFCLYFVARFYGDSKKLQKFTANRFDNYQMTTNQSVFVIAFGLALGVSLLFINNWLNGLIIVSGIGSEILTYYRKSFASQ